MQQLIELGKENCVFMCDGKVTDTTDRQTRKDKGAKRKSSKRKKKKKAKKM